MGKRRKQIKNQLEDYRYLMKIQHYDSIGGNVWTNLVSVFIRFQRPVIRLEDLLK